MEKLVDGLLEMLSFTGTYTAPAIAWEDEILPAVVKPPEQKKTVYLDRGNGRIETLRRVKLVRPYLKPDGLFAALLKAASKADWSCSLLEKTASSYLKKLLAGVMEEDECSERELRDLLTGFCRETFEKVPIPSMVRIETGGGNNTFLHLMDMEKDSGTSRWLFSAKGLKKRRKGCSLRSHGCRFWDSDQLVLPVLYNFFRKKIEKGDNTAELLMKELRSEVTDSLVSHLRAYQNQMLTVVFSKEWDSEKRRELLGILGSAGISAMDRDELPKGMTYSGMRLYVSNEIYLNLLCNVPFTMESYYSRYGLSGNEERIFSRLLMVLKTEDEADRAFENYRKVQGHTASVWQTLKNHTRINSESSLKSGFTNYFRFVEFDHDCDLTMVEEDFYKDFETVVETYLGGWRDMDCEIRIRKLGRHKAAGLFFPELWCLCVDLRSPNSLMHEYGHLYDYAHGELSRKWEFFKLRECYSELLKEACKGKEGEMFGSSKYDLGYYLTPTEVFARCFEMWLTRSLRVNNNVVKPDRGKAFAYPESAELSRLIEDYFDREFGRKQLPAVCRKYSFSGDAESFGIAV